MFGRKVLVVILLLLGVSWVNFAIPTPKDVGALEWLLKLLSPCFRVTEAEEYKECVLPPGCYCIYYTNDPKSPVPWNRHSFQGFGWYPEFIGCGALYTVVRGAYFDCNLKPVGMDPASVLPPRPAWMVRIPAYFEKIGLWLNAPKGITDRDVKGNGLYYTCSRHNRDGMDHAFIYLVEYTRVGDCLCDCKGKHQPLPREGRMFLVFWEDGCRGGDYDWNDFAAALIPCEQ